MFLRNLSLENYGVFREAHFDLATTVDKPIVLMTGNNGAGKTSILESLRIALHGRRAFDLPVSESEYLRLMQYRFHGGNLSKRCSISLDFDYVDHHTTRNVKVRRSWRVRRQHVAEEIDVLLDGSRLAEADADDLLSSIVPPEIARYFFFDGERIRELADWESEDEASLFAAVGDLLGLNILDQLRSDLLRITVTEGRVQKDARDIASILVEAEEALRLKKQELRSARAQTRKLRGTVDRARGDVRRLGALQQSELAEAQSALAALSAERRALHDDLERLSSDLLPLLCAKTLRERFGKEIEGRRRVEEREIVNEYVKQHSDDFAHELQAEGLKKPDVRRVFTALERLVHGKPLPVNTALPNMSRSDSMWMQRVIERELPDVQERATTIVNRLAEIETDIATLEARVHKAPVNDPAGDAALNELERAQRAFMEHEALLKQLENAVAEAETALETAQDVAKTQRLAAFRAGRLKLREKLVSGVLEALPKIANELQTSKQQRFARYLMEALHDLWHKTDRLARVEVSFSDRRISLFDSVSEIRKRDLSAGEKQLFAVAFIYALARISGRMMPFIVDTPLGRLDRHHRERFVTRFVPNMGHQVVLLSTDTEIVGNLYNEVRPLVASHYELSNYNGGVTPPVELALA